MSLERAAEHAERVARRRGSVLIFEGLIGTRWTVLAIQKLGDPPATISHNHDGIRDVYVTQVFEDHGTISRLPFGVDIEQDASRIISEEQVSGAILMHRLVPGKSVVLTLQPDRALHPRTIRYRFELSAQRGNPIRE